MKKILTLLLAVVLTLSLFAGCGGETGTSGSSGYSGSASNGEARTDINIAIAADPGTFNPYQFGGPDYSKICKSIYQTLAFLTLEKEFEPIIAESWEQIDNLTYTVKLKENVYDSENNHIDANDVYYSCQQHMNSAQASAWKYSDDENPVEVTGNYELTFHFKQETCTAFTSLLTGVMIVDSEAHAADSEGYTNNPIGTGPYKLEDWVVGSEVTLVKNENYWDDNPYKYFVQNMDTIRYKVIAESAQRAIELEIGGVDLIYDPQASDLNRFEDMDGYVAGAVDISKCLNIYFNCTENSVMQDKRLRQAVAYAVDTQALAISACENLGTPAASIAHPISMEWRDEYEGTTIYPLDVDKAQELIDELKAEGIDPSFTILTDENTTKRNTATVIQQAMKQLGVDVEVSSLEAATFQATYADMTAWDTYIGFGGSSALYTLSTLTTQIDRTGYPSPSELRDAIDLAFTEYVPENSDEAVALWDEEIPILNLCYVKNVYAYKEGLKGAEELDFSGMIHPGACSWE